MLRSNKNILVIGDIILDKYIIGNTSRLSPEAPVPVIVKKGEKYVLGGAANVASNLVALGCNVSLIGIIGEDNEGDIIKELLKDKKINFFDNLKSSTGTIVKTRIFSNNQQVARIDVNDYHNNIEIISNIVITNEYDVIVISDYDKGVCSDKICREVISSANNLGIPVVIDPKGISWDKYKNSTIITPNLKELSLYIGQELINSNLKLDNDISQIPNKLNINYLCLTRSEKGISLIYDGTSKDYPAEAKEVYDVSGAGDTVVSVISAFYGLVEIDELMEMANIAGGIAVAKIGTSVVSYVELNQALINRVNSCSKLFNLIELNELVNYWKSQGEKVVFTNGCFDILHKGHIKNLQASSRFGTKLIVGLNSDASTKRLKGNDRPINSEQDRAYMLSVFSFVDAIIIFDEDTPEETIKYLRPNLLVKGMDYLGKEIAGSEYVDEVKLVDFIDGYSTTKIIDKINK